MKRILSLVLSLVLFCSIFSCLNVTVNAASVSDLIFTLNSDGKSYYLDTQDISLSGAINIPSTYNGKPVTFIHSDAFRDCQNITSVTIPDSITIVGNYAFYGCLKLDSITIPDSVIIASDAFTWTGYYNNSSNWQNGVLYIGNHLIEAKDNLSGGYVIKDGTKTIVGFAFAGCTRLTSIAIPSSITNIGGYAFYRCISLRSVAIPNGVPYIESSTFGDCTSLASIEIPDSVTRIDDRAFENCTNLKDVYYSGTEAERRNISISGYNYSLLIATWHYNYVPCKPVAPKVSTTNEMGGVNVTWNKVSGATKYVVYRRGEKQTSYTQIGTTTSTTFLDKNVISGKYYCYTVRAFNSGGYSDYIYANTSTRKYMATPKLTTIYNHVNGLAIKWNAVAGVTNGYRVYRRGAGSTYWTYLGTTKNLYFIDNEVKNKSGEYYRYTVIADGGYHSKFDTTGLYLKRLANPTLTSAVSSSAGITVKWGAVKGTTGYYVYRKTANSGWTRIAAVGGTNNTTFLDKTAKKGTTYTYTVKAVYGATTSAYNAGISCYDKY